MRARRITASALLGLTTGLAACSSASGTASAPQTAPGGAPPAAQPARTAATAWAVGDADTTAAGKLIAPTVRRGHPDLLLYLGDVYETGTPSDFARHYDPLYGSLARRTLPTPGNHEWPNRDAGYRPYWRAKLGHAIPDWQKRRIAGWEILSLNSEAPHGAGSPQLAWLAQATRRSGTCRIAIFHRPRWSSGFHGDQADMAPVWDALRGHARLVLSGHDHDLQRLADRDGLRQYVLGGGGRPNVPIPRRSATRVRYVNRLLPGAARLRLSPGRATVEIVTAGGRVLDRSTATCRRLGG